MLRFVHLTRQVIWPVWNSSVRCQRLQIQLQPHQHLQQPGQMSRCLFSGKAEKLTDGEKMIVEKLKSGFPGAKSVEVSDISGGCGAMYQISIEAEEFRGKRTVQQHRLVNEILAKEIGEMHGLQLNTKIPEKEG